MILAGIAKMGINRRRLWQTRQKPIRSSLRPIHLVWAKRHDRPSSVMRQPWRGAAILNHTAQIHLHFRMPGPAVNVLRRSLLDAGAVIKVPQPNGRLGRGAGPTPTVLRTASLGEVRRRTSGHEGEVLVQRQRRRELVFAKTPKGRRNPEPTAPVATTTAGSVALAFRSARQAIAPRAANPPPPIVRSLAPGPAMLVHRQRQLVAVLSGSDRTDTPRARYAAVSPQRSADLVWRVRSEERAPAIIESPVRELAMAGAFTSPAAAPPGWQGHSASISRPAPIDAATVDKIAEDVIGRIERRIRIERERRGL